MGQPAYRGCRIAFAHLRVVSGMVLPQLDVVGVVKVDRQWRCSPSGGKRERSDGNRYADANERKEQ